MKIWSVIKFFILFLLAAIICLLAYYGMQTEMNPIGLSDALEADIRLEAAQMMENLDSSSGLGFGITDLSVKQGQDGQEQWQLKAEWATLKQESDLIEAKNISASYNLEQGEAVYVKANGAAIYNNQKDVTLYGDVYTEYQGDIIEGEKLDYSSESHSLSFSRQAKLSGKTMQGTCDILTWDLNENTITANGNIKIEFQSENLELLNETEE